MKTPKLKAQTVRRLRAIVVAILKNPQQIMMDYWFYRMDGAGPCNTAACLAGWAITLDLPKGKQMPLRAASLFSKDFKTITDGAGGISGYDMGQGKRVVRKATRLLGLTRDQASALFVPGNWPESFRYRLPSNSGRVLPIEKAKVYAGVVAERVEFFIATGGTDNDRK